MQDYMLKACLNNIQKSANLTLVVLMCHAFRANQLISKILAQ